MRTDWTSFEHFSRSEAEHEAAGSGEFDALDSSLIETLGIAYGINDDFQLSAQIGYYRGDDFIAAESDGGTVESATADPRGLTDVWLNGKWRLMHNAAGHLA